IGTKDNPIAYVGGHVMLDQDVVVIRAVCDSHRYEHHGKSGGRVARALEPLRGPPVTFTENHRRWNRRGEANAMLLFRKRKRPPDSPFHCRNRRTRGPTTSRARAEAAAPTG